MMLPSEPERTRRRALGEGGACAPLQLSWLLSTFDQFHVFIISVNMKHKYVKMIIM